MEWIEIQIKQKRILYRKVGQGNTVLLIHGFGEDGDIWNDVLQNMDGYKVIIPDLPGSGRSEMLDDMSMESMALMIKNILKNEKEERCLMIGHSMGGYVTLAFAEKFSEYLKGFGLFHSTAYADTGEKIASRIKGIEFIKQNGAQSFLKTTIPNLFASVTKEKQPDIVEEHIKTHKHLKEAALIAYYESMIKRPDRSEFLKTTPLPVLFILGRYDNAVLLNDGLAQAKMPQLSYIHILEQSGHMGMLEEKKTSATILNNFLSEAFKYHHQE